MGRDKAKKPRKQPGPSPMDRAETVDRNRRPLCGVCGGSVVRYTDAASRSELTVVHSDRALDDAHTPELVWVWDEVQCDFCGAPGAVWSYQVAPLNTLGTTDFGPGVTATDLNDTPWTACQGCADLIEAQAWDGLLQRFADRITVESGVRPNPAQLAPLAQIQQQFVQMRTGNRLPYATAA